MDQDGTVYTQTHRDSVYTQTLKEKKSLKIWLFLIYWQLHFKIQLIRDMSQRSEGYILHLGRICQEENSHCSKCKGM